MAYLDIVLSKPSYGWADANGNLIKPTLRQILSEFFSRLNIFSSRKNWLPFLSWLKILCLVPFLYLFIFNYFTFPLLGAAFLYSMIIMGTHGTIWHHRYCTHRSYTFRNNFWRFVTQNLTINIIPEEIYAISHHVHHAKSDRPGDPYNASAGFWYCFLADVNHQPIAKDLGAEDYKKSVALMAHTGVTCNSYPQYLLWGSLASPWRTLLSWILNWGFWYSVFYLVGGHPLACTLFGSAGVWGVGVRTFNYEGHGKGLDQRRDGVDFNRDDMSINQLWPGYVAGEWHNNHHLFPRSARSGFLPHQLDLAWCYIKTMHSLGAISEYRDDKEKFKAMVRSAREEVVSMANFNETDINLITESGSRRQN